MVATLTLYSDCRDKKKTDFHAQSFLSFILPLFPLAKMLTVISVRTHGYPPSGLRLPGPELHLTRPLPNRTSSSRLLWKDCIWCTTCWAAGDVGVSNLANTVRLHIYNRQIFKRYWCSVSKNKRVLEVFNSSRFPKSVHFFEYSPFYSLTDWTIHS